MKMELNRKNVMKEVVYFILFHFHIKYPFEIYMQQKRFIGRRNVFCI